MRKFVVFVLCAALSCGFVGCGGNQPGSTQSGSAQTDTNTAENVTVNADTVFEALSKEGELVLDTKHDSVESYNAAKVPNVEMIVFRMPQETRAGLYERACYIEVYPSENDLNTSVGQYESDMFWLYTSGNVLLRMDGNVSSESAQKYADALKSITQKDVALKNTENPVLEEQSASTGFTPDGIGAESAYETLKKEISTIEFSSYDCNNRSESVIFLDRTNPDSLVSGAVIARASNEDAISYANTVKSLNEQAGLKEMVLVSKNIVMTLSDGSDETFRRYVIPFQAVTGEFYDMYNSEIPGEIK